MQWAKPLPTKIRLLAWQSLVKSKFQYSLNCLAKHNPSVIPIHATFIYRSLKYMLNCKGNPDKAQLLKTVHGVDFTQYQ